MHTLRRIHCALEVAALAAAGLALVIMMFLGTFDAIFRYLFNAPIEGVDGLMEELFMPLIVYLAAAYVYATGGHIRATILSDLLPTSVRTQLFRVYDLIGAALFGLISHGIAGRAAEAYAFNEYSNNSIGYQVYPIFGIVALGAALLALRMLISAIWPQPSLPPVDDM